jgi:hypothetical protein
MRFSPSDSSTLRAKRRLTDGTQLFQIPFAPRRELDHSLTGKVPRPSQDSTPSESVAQFRGGCCFVGQTASARLPLLAGQEEPVEEPVRSGEQIGGNGARRVAQAEPATRRFDCHAGLGVRFLATISINLILILRGGV